MNRVTKFLVAAGAALCLLTACGGDEALEVYTLEEGGDTVVALDSILAEGEAMLTSIDAPTDQAAQAGLELSHTYHYRQMEDPAALAARYIGVLREEQGFTPIDEENHELAGEKDLDTLSGSLILGKASEAESDKKQIFRVIVGWSEYAVAVQVAKVDGRILPPPEPESEENAVSLPPKATSLTEQLDYFNGLDPQKLGLEGSDMSAYKVYPQQGLVRVDGVECREITVYDVNEEGNNVLVGTFFFSSDLEHMYRLQEDGIPVPLNYE